MSPGLKRAILIFNTLGFVAYLVWLSRFSTSETMRTQDGIIYYVPCLPFLFLYLLMLPPKIGFKGKPWWQSDEDYERDLREKAARETVPPAAKPETHA